MGKRKDRNNLIHSFDPKGRVSIPIHIRKKFKYGEKVVLTRGLDQCIYAFSEEEWKKLEEKLLIRFEGRPFGSKKDRAIVRKIMGEAEEVEIDAQGRIRIPGHLAEYAEIESSCYFVKMPGWFEIWNPELYRKAMKEAEELEEIEG